MTSEVFPRITVDPEICFGKPCIRGTRLRVTDVLDMFAGGASRAEILGSYPFIEDADITAALAYAARARTTKSRSRRNDALGCGADHVNDTLGPQATDRAIDGRVAGVGAKIGARAGDCGDQLGKPAMRALPRFSVRR